MDSSALPETIRDGEGSGLVLIAGTDPRCVSVIWFVPILNAEMSAPADSTSVMGAADGVCERSSVGCVASLR
jgi:hypothetical protein